MAWQQEQIQVQALFVAAMEAGAARKHLRQQQTRQLISQSQMKRAAMEDADSEDVPSDSGSEQRLLEEAETVFLEDVQQDVQHLVNTPKIQKQHHQQEQEVQPLSISFPQGRNGEKCMR
jgi:hypothetical protein